MPSVSVIIPTHNRASYLKEAIESVVAQTFQDLELIVVDDGSTDHTPELVSHFCGMDSRIQYVRQQNSGGACRARNAGIKIARGEYVTFLDDDDRWPPKKLERQVALMESNSDLGFSYTFFQVFRPSADGLIPGKIFPEYIARNFEDLMEVFVAPSTVMIRRSSVGNGIWFDSRYEHSEDFDFWLRLAQRCEFACVNDVLVMTVMDGRPHSGQDQLVIGKLTARILKNLELLPKYRNRKNLVRRHIAVRLYRVGRIYLDQLDFFNAAKFFTLAIFTDPFVRLSLRRPGERGFKLLVQILKSYAAAPLCLLKGLFQFRIRGLENEQ